jgi:hypothetical protein
MAAKDRSSKDLTPAEQHRTEQVRETKKELRNEDPITGAAGSHPVGSGLGAALGGAAAGAVAGLAGGPVGTVVGTIAGGLAGGLAGKAVAENIDPTVETAYWRDEHVKRPYYKDDYSYEDYEPAYRAGWESYDTEAPANWSDRERYARQRWENEGGQPSMTWEEAKLAAEDAYKRVHHRQSGNARH